MATYFHIMYVNIAQNLYNNYLHFSPFALKAEYNALSCTAHKNARFAHAAEKMERKPRRKCKRRECVYIGGEGSVSRCCFYFCARFSLSL